MPAILTSHTQVEIERKEPGHGGRGPVDKKPTGGGGDGDNWNNEPQGRRGPREMLLRVRTALLFALVGDFMFFAALAGIFWLRQSTGHFDAHQRYVLDWRHLEIPSILWLNTLLLLASSATMELARRNVFHEPDVMAEWLGLGRPSTRRTAPWLLATIALGVAFLGGQYLAWRQLAAQGVFFASNPSSYFFYTITGSHGVHLLLGLAGLIWAACALLSSMRLQTRQILIDCTAWYWHTMGGFWLFLMALLVFFQ